MRIAGWLLAGVAASGAWAGGVDLPSGKFEGRGTWKGPEGSTGSYEVSTEIEGRTLTSKYVWAEPGKQGRTETITMNFAPEGKNATFVVTDGGGKSIGEGFCFEGQCSYKATTDAIQVEETIRWIDGRLFKLGTKAGPGFRVVWTEELSAR